MKLTWETEIDTPATVAVIGGGAIGIEAALYARFLGYYVLLIEGAKMAQSWREAGRAPMLEPFGEAASPLGLGALEAHRPDSTLPSQSDVLTGLEFAEKYLVPLARTDLLIDSVNVHSRVASVSRLEVRRETPGDIQDRADVEFRLAIHSKSRGWFTERADIVLDCSGLALPRWLGPGGGLAVGEIEHADVIERQLIDAPAAGGKQIAQLAGKRVLLFGTGRSALLNLLVLLEITRSNPETRITWLVTLEPGIAEPSQWLDRIRATGEVGQQLAARPEIQDALSGAISSVVPLACLGIERITNSASGLEVRVQTTEDGTLDLQCDRIVSGAGHQPDWSHAEPLRVGRSATLDRPALESAGLAGDSAEQVGSGSIELGQSILTMEPHYYVLGSKSFALAHDRFTLAQGHQQIRHAFALIGGRSDLDLYRHIQR
ncbi:MAG: hypothetical protein ACTHOU_02935 [Aureliella sp.]